MWYEEKVWPTLLGLGMVALFALLKWSENRKPCYLLLSALCIPLGAGAIWFERSRITPREQVTADVSSIVDAFVRKDAAGTLDYVSERAPQLRWLVEMSMKRVDITDTRITDVHVEISPSQTPRARSHFRVNARVKLVGGADLGHQPTRWLGTWDLEGERWKLIEIDQLDPITGDVVNKYRNSGL